MSVVREARWQDIPELAALEKDLFAGQAWSEATWWAELAGRPRRHYLVATSDQGAADALPPVTGYGGLDVSGEVADLMTLAVSPAAQGQGLGARLLDALVAAARRRGAEWLMLEVRADNDVARALYESRGFAVAQVRPRYYRPDDVDAVVMRLRLGGTR